MSVLVVPVFRPAIESERTTTGEFLGRDLEELEQIAEENRLVGLGAFSDSREVPDDFDGAPWEFIEQFGAFDEWFDCGDGLAAVQRLAAAIKASSALQQRLEAADAVLDELDDLQQLLATAHQAGCMFRLELDY